MIDKERMGYRENEEEYEAALKEAPKLRGFAAMKVKDPERLKSLAIKGGLAMPNEKRAYFKDRELAASAGKKGGETSRGGGRKKVSNEQ